MKPEAKASNDQLRKETFKLLMAVIEERQKDAEKHAQTVIILINHLKRKSQS